MKITTLLGSARKKGNTAKVLGWMEDEFKSRGHEVSQIYLDNKDINGCLGCAKCREKPEEIACVRDDDAIKIFEQMIESDVVLFTSPLYFWGFSAQIKRLIDRCFSMVAGYHTPDHTSLLKGKRIGLLVTGAGPYEENAEGVFDSFDRIADYFIAGKKCDLFVGDCTVPDEIPESVREKAVEFSRSLLK